MDKFTKQHNKMVMETGETKSRNKLVKSKKGWLKVALGTTFASAALFSFNAVNQVNADTTTPQAQSTNQPNQQSTSEPLPTNDAQAQQPSAQEQQVQISSQLQTSNQEKAMQPSQTNQNQTTQTPVTQPQSAQRAAITKLASNDYPGNTATIQYGVLNQDVKGQSGTVYKAGTQVSRGTLNMDVNPSGDYYLTISMNPLVGEQTFGPDINPAYVSPINIEHYSDLEATNGQWGSKSYFNQEDSGTNVTPVNGQGVQADKSKLQSDINQAKQLLAGKVKFSPSATTTGVDPTQYLQAHLDKAEVVNNDNTATQAQVDSSVVDLGFALSQVEADGSSSNGDATTPTDNGKTPATNNGGSTSTTDNSGKAPADNNGNTNKNDSSIPSTPANNTNGSSSDSEQSGNKGSATNDGSQTKSNNITNPKSDNASNELTPQTDTQTTAGNNKIESSSQTEGKHFAPVVKTNSSANKDNDYTGRHTAPAVVVKNGQTISQIATDYGVSVAALLQNNPDIKDANNIVNGQVINLPSSQHDDKAAKNVDKTGNLPQTGQTQNLFATVSGIFAILLSALLGLGEFFKTRKED